MTTEQKTKIIEICLRENISLTSEKEHVFWLFHYKNNEIETVDTLEWFHIFNYRNPKQTETEFSFVPAYDL